MGLLPTSAFSRHSRYKFMLKLIYWKCFKNNVFNFSDVSKYYFFGFFVYLTATLDWIALIFTLLDLVKHVHSPWTLISMLLKQYYLIYTLKKKKKKNTYLWWNTWNDLHQCYQQMTIQRQTEGGMRRREVNRKAFDRKPVLNQPWLWWIL